MFVQVLSTFTLLIVSVFWYLLIQLNKNKKKRIRRLRSLSEKLPHLQPQSPKKLERRRVKVLISSTPLQARRLALRFPQLFKTCYHRKDKYDRTPIDTQEMQSRILRISTPPPTELYEENNHNTQIPSLFPKLPIINVQPRSSEFSLLDSLARKKSRSCLKGYNIFPGGGSLGLIGTQENELSTNTDEQPIVSGFSDISEDSSENDSGNEITNILSSSSEPLFDGPKIPDSYKYISKKSKDKYQLDCYTNPYLSISESKSEPEEIINNHLPQNNQSSSSLILEDEDPYSFTPFGVEVERNLSKEKDENDLQRKIAAYKKVNTLTTSSQSTDSEGIAEDFDFKKCSTERMLQLSEENFKMADPVPEGGVYDEFDRQLDGVDLHDWNERFQRIMTIIRKFDCNTPIALQIKANRSLIHLAEDFIYASSTYGKIIIAEAYSAEKTIKPISIGGKLGGTKYIVQNILFKFAVDEAGLYSDYAAAKVAGHELKGLINYFNCNIENLCLPLMSLVDYRGFRLIAMSILPIRGSETIIYGSDNYGETIHNSNPEMEKLLRKAAKMMNIKEHKCGTRISTSNSLCSPADLEGHIGIDKRFYLLDFSRVLPPEKPVKGIQSAHLYRLLRPEHVKLFEKPLCSDAFSGFIAKFNYKQDNMEIVEATDKLIHNTIPNFAKDLTTMMIDARDNGILESFRVTEAIHRQGINVRYIGLLRKHIKELDPRTFLLIEMSARVVKNKLRKLLRKKMKALKVPLEEPYRRLVISYLNLVLGDSEASEEYWNNNLKRAIQRTFIGGLSDQEINEAYSLKSSLNNFSNDRVDGKLLLFLRLQKMTGLRFTNRINEEFTQNPNNWAPRGAQPLDETDLEDIGLRVKHMNIISHAKGFVLQMKGAMAWAHDPVAAERFYLMATTKYEEALDMNPNDYQVLIRLAEIAVQSIEGHARGVSAMKYDIELPEVQYANMLFQRAVTANPNDSYGLYKYALFLDKCNIPETAEEMFLRSLEADPENVACFQEYGNFLSENSKHDTAELFYVRGSELAQRFANSMNNDSGGDVFDELNYEKIKSS